MMERHWCEDLRKYEDKVDDLRNKMESLKQDQSKLLLDCSERVRNVETLMLNKLNSHFQNYQECRNQNLCTQLRTIDGQLTEGKDVTENLKRTKESVLKDLLHSPPFDVLQPHLSVRVKGEVAEGELNNYQMKAEELIQEIEVMGSNSEEVIMAMGHKISIMATRCNDLMNVRLQSTTSAINEKLTAILSSCLSELNDLHGLVNKMTVLQGQLGAWLTTNEKNNS